MKISYDPEIDALYITLLREGKSNECRSVRLSDQVALNRIGVGKNWSEIEILDAKSRNLRMSQERI